VYLFDPLHSFRQCVFLLEVDPTNLLLVSVPFGVILRLSTAPGRLTRGLRRRTACLSLNVNCVHFHLAVSVRLGRGTSSSLVASTITKVVNQSRMANSWTSILPLNQQDSKFDQTCRKNRTESIKGDTVLNTGKLLDVRVRLWDAVCKRQPLTAQDKSADIIPVTELHPQTLLATSQAQIHKCRFKHPGQRAHPNATRSATSQAQKQKCRFRKASKWARSQIIQVLFYRSLDL
jgi:hypothetical protein